MSTPPIMFGVEEEQRRDQDAGQRADRGGQAPAEHERPAHRDADEPGRTPGWSPRRACARPSLVRWKSRYTQAHDHADTTPTMPSVPDAMRTPADVERRRGTGCGNVR